MYSRWYFQLSRLAMFALSTGKFAVNVHGYIYWRTAPSHEGVYGRVTFTELS
jgi:hypothetical protein